MPVSWIETFPRFFCLRPGGFVDVTISSKIPGLAKPFRQNILYQVIPDSAAGTAITTYAGPPTTVSVYAASALAAEADALQFISELDPTSDVIVVPAQEMSDFLTTQLITPQRSIQVAGTIYKRITLRFFESKSGEGVIGPTTTRGLREYGNINLTFPASLRGSIDSNNPPVQGALAINQYAGNPVSLTAGAFLRIQQDRPGRYLIRGCGLTADQALSDSRVDALLVNLRIGASFSTGTTYGLVPVIDVLGDIWTIRASQSSGYVRVSSQAGRDPTQTVGPGGAP